MPTSLPDFIELWLHKAPNPSAANISHINQLILHWVSDDQYTLTPCKATMEPITGNWTFEYSWNKVFGSRGGACNLLSNARGFSIFCLFLVLSFPFHSPLQHGGKRRSLFYLRACKVLCNCRGVCYVTFHKQDGRGHVHPTLQPVYRQTELWP